MENRSIIRDWSSSRRKRKKLSAKKEVASANLEVSQRKIISLLAMGSSKQGQCIVGIKPIIGRAHRLLTQGKGYRFKRKQTYEDEDKEKRAEAP
jgi:hypothetical protein